MKTYNIGIVGYGGFGKFLHYWWNKMDGVKVVAVSHVHPNHEKDWNVKQYENWEDLIRSEEIDIVSIATPPAFHVEIACAAMRQNKHVLLEKPVALNNEGAEQILQTQKETGKVLIVDHMLRYNPIVKAFVQLSHQKTFGELRHAEVTNYAQDNSLPQEHWFWDKELSGGIFIEHGVHFFDIINALTDQKFRKVYGASHNRNEKQQDQVSAMVQYNEGLIASHYHSFSGPGFFEQTTIRLMYDLAKVEIEGWIPIKGRIKVLVNAASKEKLAAIPGFEITDEAALGNLSDISRPEGWGDISMENQKSISCAGINYDVKEMLSGTFEIRQTKAEIYGNCLQEVLLDLIAKIEDPDHQLNVTVEDAYESLKIAHLADLTSRQP
jgi:predicted dehydrogenase